MHNFITDLSTAADEHVVHTEYFSRIREGLDSAFDGHEAEFKCSMAAGPHSTVLLGKDKWNTPYIYSSESSVTIDPVMGGSDTTSHSASSYRQRQALIEQFCSQIENINKSLFIVSGLIGQDIVANPEESIELQGATWANTTPSPICGYPIYVTLDDTELHVGTLYNVAEKHRLYVHHSGLYSSLDEYAEERLRPTKRADVCYRVFALALDKVAFVTNNIDGNPIDPALFLEMEGRDSFPGTSDFVDVLAQRRETIATELDSAEQTFTKLQERSLEAASSLVSLRRLNEEIQNSESGLVSVSSIDHPMVKKIFARKSHGHDKIYIMSEEVFFKPSSNPEEVQYDEERGISCGHFLILISLSREPSPISFINTDYRVLAYDGQPMNHPHVFKDGNPCLGSFGSSITNALANGDLASVIDMSFMFLGQANQDDSAGRFWNRWEMRNEENGGEYHADTLEVF